MAINITKTEWFEIAAVAFFVALVGYIIRLWMAGAYPSNSGSSGPAIISLPSGTGETPVTAATTTPTSVGVPNIPLPGAYSGDCGCNDCASGSSNPTIDTMVANANAALAAIQAASNSTLEAITKMGVSVQDVIGNGTLQYEFDGTSVY